MLWNEVKVCPSQKAHDRHVISFWVRKPLMEVLIQIGMFGGIKIIVVHVKIGLPHVYIHQWLQSKVQSN